MHAATFERIRALVRERAAIVLDPGKEYLVESRLQDIVRARGLCGIDDLCARLDSDGPELAYEVVEAMTTNETSFFRDHTPFDVLRQVVIPELMRRNARDKSLRIWCAASSTGQEPYSIAITLREHFPELRSWNVQILATDISRQVLKRAQLGRYKQVEVNRGLSAAQVRDYFTRDGGEFQISSDVRDMVKFEELNLIQHWPRLPQFDVVFLRNVLIYFDQVTKHTVLAKLRQRLSLNGFLFLGGSETLAQAELGLERLPLAHSGCYRQVRPAR